MPDKDRDGRRDGRDCGQDGQNRARARARARERRRDRQRADERRAAGMCPKCGKAKPAPGAPSASHAWRRLASPIAPAMPGRRPRAASTVRMPRAAGALRAPGPNAATKPGQQPGLCTKCGVHRSEEGRSRCEPCLERRNAADRRQWQLRRSAGRCGPCGAPAPSGAARCERCSTVQAKRPSRKAYARKIYARRKARSECTDCGAYSAGASRCAPCARRSYVRSGEHRGLPAGPPAFHVVEIETGHALSEWETLAEARASLAFGRIDPDTVTIEADIPTMSTLASW